MLLDRAHGRLGVRAEDAVHVQRRDIVVRLRRHVDEVLQVAHVVAAHALQDVPARVQEAAVRHGVGRHVRHRVAVDLDQLVLRQRAEDAVRRKAVPPLERHQRLARLFVENAVDRRRGDLVVEKRDDRENQLRLLHIAAGVALPQHLGVEALDLLGRQPLRVQIVQALDAVVDRLDLVPGRLADDAVHREVENALEGPHGVLGLAVEIPVQLGDFRDGRVVFRNAVELPLDDAHLLAHVAEAQRAARIRHRHIGDRRVEDDVDVIPVVVLQDLIRDHALIGEVDSPPLRKAGAFRGRAVAVLGKKRLHVALLHDVIVEDVVHDLRDVLENIPPVDVHLVVLRRIRDVEVVALAAVKLRVDAVQGIGDLREDVGADRGLRPVRVNLAGGHVLDVIRKGDAHVFRRLIRQAEVHGDVFRDHRCAAQRHKAPSFLTGPCGPKGTAPAGST